jgi:predicted enzyme related to lactoylglutathione lyase
MPRVESYAPGTPSWVDLASPDVGVSVAFYGDLFGWEAPELPAEAGGYRMFEVGGVPVAGCGPIMMEGQPPAWTTYVSVDDADAAIARVTEAGGTVFLPPMDVLEVGRMAVFADTTGAACAVWQPRAHPGAGLVNEPGALVWNELSTRDPAAAVTFYSSVFGWTANTMDMGGTDYTEWQLDGSGIGGMMEMPAEVPAEVPSYWLTYFGTDDCDATVERAVAGGATVIVPATDIPPGRFSILVDPAGATFAVIKMAAA